MLVICTYISNKVQIKQIKLTENLFLGILREVKLVLEAVQKTLIVNIEKIYFDATLWQTYYHLLPKLHSQRSENKKE